MPEHPQRNIQRSQWGTLAESEAVEVASPGDQQAILAGQPQEHFDIFRRMEGVPHLYALQPQGSQGRDVLYQAGGGGMGQYGHASRPSDETDDLYRRHPQPGHIRRPVPADIALEGFRDGGDIPPVDHCAGNVESPDGATSVAETGDLIPFHGHPQGCQPLQHLPGPLYTGGLHGLHALVERPVPGVHIQSQNMEVTHRPIGTDLHPGDNFQTGATGGSPGFRKPLYGIVVRQGNGRQPLLQRQSYHLGGGQRPVRSGSVDMKVYAALLELHRVSTVRWTAVRSCPSIITSENEGMQTMSIPSGIR